MAQEIVCDTDAMARLCGTLDRLGAKTAMIVVPHGAANAILLPHTMRFNLEASAQRQALIAQAMGINTAGMAPHAAGLAAADAEPILRVLRAAW